MKLEIKFDEEHTHTRTRTQYIQHHCEGKLSLKKYFPCAILSRAYRSHNILREHSLFFSSILLCHSIRSCLLLNLKEF